MTYLTHVALSDGANAGGFSLREAFSDESMQWASGAVRALLTAGTAPLPQLGDGWLITGARQSSKALLCRIIRDGHTLVITFGVAAHSRAGAKLWRTLHGSRLPCPPEPWVASRMHIEGPSEPGFAGFIQMIEHSIGWAFLELIREEKTNAR